MAVAHVKFDGPAKSADGIPVGSMLAFPGWSGDFARASATSC